MNVDRVVLAGQIIELATSLAFQARSIRTDAAAGTMTVPTSDAFCASMQSSSTRATQMVGTVVAANAAADVTQAVRDRIGAALPDMPGQNGDPDTPGVLVALGGMEAAGDAVSAAHRAMLTALNGAGTPIATPGAVGVSYTVWRPYTASEAAGYVTALDALLTALADLERV